MKNRPMKLQLLNDYVAIELDDVPEVTPGGVILPDTARKRSQTGTIFAVGKGRKVEGVRQALELTPGDHVCFRHYAGDILEHAGKELLLMREEDVIGLVARD